SFIEDLGKAAPQWEPISLEKLSELDADHIILLAADNEEGITNLDSSNVWAKVPAVENDNVHIIDAADAWTICTLSFSTAGTFAHTLLESKFDDAFFVIC